MPVSQGFFIDRPRVPRLNVHGIPWHHSEDLAIAEVAQLSPNCPEPGGKAVSRRGMALDDNEQVSIARHIGRPHAPVGARDIHAELSRLFDFLVFDLVFE